MIYKISWEDKEAWFDSKSKRGAVKLWEDYYNQDKDTQEYTIEEAQNDGFS